MTTNKKIIYKHKKKLTKFHLLKLNYSYKNQENIHMKIKIRN